MKQPSMFHKGDRSYEKGSDDDIYDMDFDNPIGPIFDAIQKQRAKQRATIPRNSISDPVGVMIHQYIKTAGVKARPAKRILALLSEKGKYEPKILSNLSDMLNTNRFEPITIMIVAIKHHFLKYYKSINRNNNMTRSLESVFNNISFYILKTAMSVHIKSIAQEIHAVFNDPDLDPLKADQEVKDRLDSLNQQLQHQIKEDYQFDISPSCVRHNLSPPCKVKNCTMPHVCRCGATTHTMTDKQCPLYTKEDDAFFDKITNMNNYHARRNARFKRDRWRRFNAPSNPPHNNNHDHIHNK